MSTVLSTDLVRLDENLGTDEATVLGSLAAIAGDAGGTVDVDPLASHASRGGRILSTGLPGGIAIAHCRSAGVDVPTVVFARLREKVDFGGEDGGADLAFLVVEPEDVGATGPSPVTRLARALVCPEFTDGLRDASTRADAAALVDQALAHGNLASDDAVHSDGGGMARGERWGGWMRRVLTTGVSYTIPFVAGGGLLIALGYLLGGYDIVGAAEEIVTQNSFTDLPDIDESGLDRVLFDSPFMAYLGALLFALGATAFKLFVPAMAGYIAFAIADRPGIAPGFIAGALAVDLAGLGTAQSGFLGAIVGGALSGVVANRIAGLAVPDWARGLMPVLLVPLLTTLIVGLFMVTALNGPLANVMSALNEGLDGMSAESAVLLGAVLGLMMAFDIGGPLNKVAYTFAVSGIGGAAALPDAAPQLGVMAAVMLAGMTPPLAMALATIIRPTLFDAAERDNGKAAAALGFAFISEGAIPFAAADPLRVIPAIMAGSAVTGGLSMALEVTSRAPHGGIFVLFTIDNLAGFFIALIAGTLVAASLVCVLKSFGAREVEIADV